jgi:hypothetical protein
MSWRAKSRRRAMARFTPEQVAAAKVESEATFFLVRQMRRDAEIDRPTPIRGSFPYFRR